MPDDKLKQFYIDMQKELCQFSDNKSQYPSATLYHYTDTQGLVGMLSSRRLWMNHYEKLNDTNEIKHARDLVLKIVDAHKQGSNHKEFWQKYCDKFKTVLEVGDYFVFSFSSSHDNQHLWSRYAKNGGVAIGFRKEYFIPIMNMNKRKRRFNLTSAQMIHYCDTDFSAYVNKLIVLVENYIEANNLKLDIELAACLTTFFMTDLPKLKNNNWADECECRLYQFGFKDSVNMQLPSQDRIYATPRVSKGGKDLVLRRFKQKYVCEIWMGSSCQMSRSDIQILLRNYQFTNVDIFLYKNNE